MSNVVQRHIPNVLHDTAHIDHTILVCLNHSHLTAGEVGEQHPESNGDKQQGFVLFFDTQVKQRKCDDVHDQELRFGNDVAKRRHLIQIVEYLFHHPIVINTSSSETASPEPKQIAVIVPLNSERTAL